MPKLTLTWEEYMWLPRDDLARHGRYIIFEIADHLVPSIGFDEDWTLDTRRSKGGEEKAAYFSVEQLRARKPAPRSRSRFG